MLLLHISDIHFKHTEVGQPDDPNKALRNDMIQDVKKMRDQIGAPADGILLSGDIAFAGKAAEYDFAYTWLESELCPAAGCRIENVFVIPGNHDVDRTAEAGPAQVMVRANLRQVATNKLNDEIRKWMRDRTSANVIFGPIDNYNRFAAKFLCALRPYLDDVETQGEGGEEPPAQPFARRDLTLNDGSVLRLWGFNSVLVSDANDAEALMLVDPAASQIEAEDGVAHLVMCHHPFGWLRNKRAFEDRLNAVAKIQLFGHEHTRRIEEAKRHIRIRAGALLPDRDDPEWKSGYNWIDVSVGKDKEKRSLVVRVWVRMHEVAQFIAVPDPDDNEVWENSFVLPDWDAAPAKPADGKKEDAVVQVLEPPMTQTSTPATVRSVTIKIFKLKEHEQRRVISKMELDRPGDRDLKDYELVINAVRRSRDEGSLDKLDALLDETLAAAGRG
ncbi:MAG: metallophosphoesterase [Xanthobacteraceae bacterium]